MRMHSTVLLGTALAAVTMLALAMTSQTQSQPQPIAIEPLSQRHAFPDEVAAQITLTPTGRTGSVIDLDDVSNVAVVRLTVQPGAKFPWHTHPGPVVVAVTEGEFVYVFSDDCSELRYPAGTAFVDPGFDNVHMAFNPSGDEEMIGVAIFLAAPDEGALSLPVEQEEGARLDEACGIDR